MYDNVFRSFYAFFIYCTFPLKALLLSIFILNFFKISYILKTIFSSFNELVVNELCVINKRIMA